MRFFMAVDWVTELNWAKDTLVYDEILRDWENKRQVVSSQFQNFFLGLGDIQTLTSESRDSSLVTKHSVEIP